MREFIGLDDPFGNRIELVAGQQTLGRPVAFSRRAGITEFGHVCLDAPDVREAYRFWSTTFNAKVSDWIGDGACLMRIDPVHHKLAVFQADEPGLCHMNFQVAEIDDIFRNWHFLLDHGVTIEMGPGRHPQSTAVFLYFLGPEGFTYEYSFGVRRIEDDAAWTPRYFDPDELGSIDMWLGAPVRTVSQPQLRSATPAQGPAARPRVPKPASTPAASAAGASAVDQRHRVRNGRGLVAGRAVGQHPQRGALQVVRHLGQRALLVAGDQRLQDGGVLGVARPPASCPARTAGRCGCSGWSGRRRPAAGAASPRRPPPCRPGDSRCAPRTTRRSRRSWRPGASRSASAWPRPAPWAPKCPIVIDRASVSSRIRLA